MAVTKMGQTPTLVCKSTDTKPTVFVEDGTQLVEYDTGKLYFFDAASAEWVEFGSEGA